MVQHNGQLADPTNWFSQQAKLLTDKKEKTPDIRKKIDDLHWEGGLYQAAVEEEVEIEPGVKIKTGTIIVPGFVIRGALKGAARAKRQGELVLRSIFFREENWPLLIGGYEDDDEKWVMGKTVHIDEIRNDVNFRDSRGTVNPNTRGRVMQCRPIFHHWELKFEIMFRPDLISPFDIYEIVKILGRDTGLSDHRKLGGGRFEIIAPEPPDQPVQDEENVKPKKDRRSKGSKLKKSSQNESGNGDSSINREEDAVEEDEKFFSGSEEES
jgi:hypothetical protein